MSDTIVKSGGKILTQTNAAVVATYVYIGLNALKFKHWSLNWTLTATTLTFEFTNEKLAGDFNKATAAELNALNWVDLTEARTGAATQTATGSYTDDQNEGWFMMRVKVLPTNATNACDLYFNGK